MSDVAAVITATAALVAAIGGIIAAVLAYRARSRVEDVHTEIELVKGEFREVGKRLDGRLSELVLSSTALAKAEGVLEGEQKQRDRMAPPETIGK